MDGVEVEVSKVEWMGRTSAAIAVTNAFTLITLATTHPYLRYDLSAVILPSQLCDQ